MSKNSMSLIQAMISRPVTIQSDAVSCGVFFMMCLLFGSWVNEWDGANNWSDHQASGCQFIGSPVFEIERQFLKLLCKVPYADQSVGVVYVTGERAQLF
jgi:hypothetical protein